MHAVHEQVLYRAVPGPAAEPPADGDPLAATLRQDPPRGSRAAHPRQGVGERVVVDRGGLRRGRVNGCATLMNRSSVMSYPGVHICVIYGTDGGPNCIWSLALAVGFITFREGNGIALAVLIVVAFALQLLHAIHMAGGLSYLNVTNGLFMIAIIVFAGLLGLLLSMMMRR